MIDFNEIRKLSTMVEEGLATLKHENVWGVAVTVKSEEIVISGYRDFPEEGSVYFALDISYINPEHSIDRWLSAQPTLRQRELDAFAEIAAKAVELSKTCATPEGQAFGVVFANQLAEYRKSLPSPQYGSEQPVPAIGDDEIPF